VDANTCDLLQLFPNLLVLAMMNPDRLRLLESGSDNMNPDRLRLLEGGSDYRGSADSAPGYTIRGRANQTEMTGSSKVPHFLTGANSSTVASSPRQPSVSEPAPTSGSAFITAGFIFPKKAGNINRRPDSILLAKRRYHENRVLERDRVQQNAIMGFRCLVFYGHFSDHPTYLGSVIEDLSWTGVTVSDLKSMILLYTTARSAYLVHGSAKTDPASAPKQEIEMMNLVDDFEEIMRERRVYTTTQKRLDYIDATRNAWRREFGFYANARRLLTNKFTMPPPLEVDWTTDGTSPPSIFLQETVASAMANSSRPPPRLSRAQDRSTYRVRSPSGEEYFIKQENGMFYLRYSHKAHDNSDSCRTASDASANTPKSTGEKVATRQVAGSSSRPKTLPEAAEKTPTSKSQLLQTRLQEARSLAQRKTSASQPLGQVLDYGPDPMEGVTYSQADLTLPQAATGIKSDAGNRPIVRLQTSRPMAADLWGKKNGQGVQPQTVGGPTPRQSTMSPSLMDKPAGRLPPSRIQQNTVPSSIQASATPTPATAIQYSPRDQDAGGQAKQTTKKFAEIVLDAKEKYEALAKKHNLSDALKSKVMNQVMILDGVAATIAADVDEDLGRLG
jgi:hypothetical protein